MNRLFKIFFMLCALLTVLLFPPAVHAQESETLVRVGFPIQQGLTELDENGNYSGYTCDYLKEIAQYTGWTYEFVEAEGTMDEQLTTLMQMLENGEIDILGAMNYSEQLSGMYDFPSSNYGNAYYVIAVKQDEDRIDEYNFVEFSGLRIALLSQAQNSNDKFFQYAKLNGIDYEVVWCEDDTEQYEKVNNGDADALLSIDLSLEGPFRPITKFSPSPFYFATTKGNTRIVNELNQAITYIAQINPMLQTTLYNRYFSRSNNQLILNSQEKTYIQEHPVIKVLVHDGFGPIQYYSESGEIRGVARDLLLNIAEKAGLEVEFLYADTYAEYEDGMTSREADLILSVQYDYDTALRKNLLLSNPYLETESVLVVHEGLSASELSGKKKAVYKGDRKENEDTGRTIYYDSSEACLQAVETGECDYTYANSYTASYYQRKNRHEHTIIYPQTGNDSVKYSIGILRKSDKQLSAILNKGLNSIDSRELESFIYNNAQQNQTTTFRTFLRDNPFTVLGSLLFIALFLLLLLYVYYRSKIKMAKELELENTRYRYLSDIMKEVTFTYDYKKDRITTSEEGIRIFDTAGQIDHYSRYQSKTFVEEGAPTLYELLAQRTDQDIEMRLHSLEDGMEWYRIIIKIVMDKTEAVSAIGRVQNIHQERLEREHLMHTSRIDGLTGVLNSATIKQEIDHMLETCVKPPALLITDMDGFKDINDRYGHYVGDQVLIRTAAALKEVFCKNAVVGRLGGDEFIVCMENSDRKWIEEKCQELFQILGEHQDDDCPIPTISIGISPRREGDDFIRLYQRADALLYEVKNCGKNNFRIGD